MMRVSRKRRIERFCGIFMAFLLLSGGYAWAVSSPGVPYSSAFKPDYIQLPESFKETDAALYQMHGKLLEFPKRQAQLEKERDAKLVAIRQNEDLSISETRDQTNAVKEDFKGRFDANLKEWNELRNAFIFLATEHLKKQSDPDLLLFLAQELYGLRGLPPEVLKTQSATSKTEDKKDAKTKEKEEAKPAGGKPSTMALQEFKSIFDRIIAACEEIRKEYPSYAQMDRVIRLLAAIKMETGSSEDAVYLYKELLAKMKNSPYVGETLFQLGEYEFSTPTSFDHHTTAADYYEKALTHFGPSQSRYYLAKYKLGWAQYLSPDLSEEAQDTLVSLYKDIKKVPKPSLQQLAIRSEILELIRQISSRYKSGGGNVFSK